MKKQLISIIVTSTLLTGTAQTAYAGDQGTTDHSHSETIGTGIGAVAGALLAGPVGFVAGGVIGNLAGKHAADREAEALAAEQETPDSTVVPVLDAPVEEETADTLIVAQASATVAVIEETVDDEASKLKDTLVRDISLDVYFLSGSTTVQAFYEQRLKAIHDLLQQMPDIDVYLEGYSDRRGDKDTNLALSNQRLQSVRDGLLQAGVDPARIRMNALGEQQFLSTPGDLEAYSFDRRVVIRFEYAKQDAKGPIALMEQDAPI